MFLELFAKLESYVQVELFPRSFPEANRTNEPDKVDKYSRPSN